MAPRFTELQVIDTLLIQGVTIRCFRCGEPITREDVKRKNCQREHLHETGLEGPNIPENCRYSHADRPCHAQITDGPPATSAGGSKHKIAHTRRLEKATVLHKAVMAGTAEREPSRIRSRGFSDRSRPFQKRPDGYKHNWRGASR